MPLNNIPSIDDYRAKRKADAEKRRKSAELTRAWQAGELTWNEYIQQEKKYRL